MEDEGATDLRPAGGPAASSRPPLPPPRSPAPSAAAGAATSQTNITSCLSVCLTVNLCVLSPGICLRTSCPSAELGGRSGPPAAPETNDSSTQPQSNFHSVHVRLFHPPHQGPPMANGIWLALFSKAPRKKQHFLGKG